MSDPADQANYPPWVTRTNRLMTSPLVVYGAAALFVIDGATRLADERVTRGVINLAVAALLVGTRNWVAARASGEKPPSERQLRRLAQHPVATALLAGLTWGALMSAFLIGTREGPIALALALGLGTGILFFGPVSVFLARRYGHVDETST